jgi:hypothetical protein
LTFEAAIILRSGCTARLFARGVDLGAVERKTQAEDVRKSHVEAISHVGEVIFYVGEGNYFIGDDENFVGEDRFFFGEG